MVRMDDGSTEAQSTPSTSGGRDTGGTGGVCVNRVSFSSLPAMWVTRSSLLPATTMQQPVGEVSTRRWSGRCPLPSRHLNSRLPGGKLTSSTNLPVRAVLAQTVVGTHPKPKCPHAAASRPCKRTFLQKAVRLLCGRLCTETFAVSQRNFISMENSFFQKQKMGSSASLFF